MGQVQPICPFTNTFVCKWQKSLLKHAFEATVPSKSLSSTPSEPLCGRTLCASMPSKPVSTSLLEPGFENHTSNTSSQPLRARSHSSKSRFEAAVRNHYSNALFGITGLGTTELCSRTLFHFAPCMDMHGSTLAYRHI